MASQTTTVIFHRAGTCAFLRPSRPGDKYLARTGQMVVAADGL
jgi:hypothetical protein